MSKEGVVTRAVSAEVFNHVMTTAGLLEEDIEWLRSTARVQSMVGVHVYGRRDWRGLPADISPMVMAVLESVYDWLVWYENLHEGRMPQTLEEWQEVFTQDFIGHMSTPVPSPVKSEYPIKPNPECWKNPWKTRKISVNELYVKPGLGIAEIPGYGKVQIR